MREIYIYDITIYDQNNKKNSSDSLFMYYLLEHIRKYSFE